MTPELEVPSSRFTLGICASDGSRDLPSLVSFLLAEDYGPRYSLDQVLLVASGCPEATLGPIRRMAASNPELKIIEEPVRKGKAEAINRILKDSTGEFVVMVNSDAFPSASAIRNLLALADQPEVGIASAQPVFEEGRGLLQESLMLMWSAHNLISLELNHAGISNHACDELMAVRRSVVSSLPDGLVNDGAYMGGLAKAKGLKVKFSTDAMVRIAVPQRPIELIRQRRRIIFGHIQVWKELGKPPKTIESLLLTRPRVSLRALVRTLSKNPRLIPSFAVLLAAETISVGVGVIDAIRSTKTHAVWRRDVN
jgi:cellulose synthase/poly-beta-1,6-N-acetylglucosamine synthase-like glycosyltransferase